MRAGDGDGDRGLKHVAPKHNAVRVTVRIRIRVRIRVRIRIRVSMMEI